MKEYRVERRAKDNKTAKDFFGHNYENNRKWHFVRNSSATLRSLLAIYPADNPLYEFRIKVAKDKDKPGQKT